MPIMTPLSAMQSPPSAHLSPQAEAPAPAPSPAGLGAEEGAWGGGTAAGGGGGGGFLCFD